MAEESLDSIISSAFEEIGDSGDHVDTSADVQADAAPADADPEAAPADGATPVAAVAAPAAPVATPEETALLKDLEELGLRAPKPGERENRLPYSRSVKITQNAVKRAEKRLQDAHAVAVSEYSTKAEKAEARLKIFDNLEQLAERDPEGYIRALARENPTYQRFLTPGVAAPAAPGPAAPRAKVSEKPKPDLQFKDGSTGYSEEAAERMIQYYVDQAVGSVKDEYDSRLQPFEKERQAAAMVEAQLPMVRAAIAQAEKVWGPLYKQNESEINRVMTTQGVRFHDAIQMVLVPKLSQSRDQQRADILAELNRRPEAARTTVAAPAVAKPQAKDESVDDIIADAFRQIAA